MTIRQTNNLTGKDGKKKTGGLQYNNNDYLMLEDDIKD